jgi:DNA mismatch repair ATPase MutS
MMQCGLFVTAGSLRATPVQGIFTHFIRAEDPDMTSGRLDEELRRMNTIAGQITPRCLVLFNESFAGTNEREGSEIGYQITRALLDAQIRVLFVTHRYGFADRFRRENPAGTLFLRAERGPDGHRNYQLAVNDPLPTSYGEDLYNRLGGWLDEDKALTVPESFLSGQNEQWWRAPIPRCRSRPDASFSGPGRPRSARSWPR